MAITLKFFMIKRGLTIDKLAQKSGATTVEELVSYAKSLDIGVTDADFALIKDYFVKLNDVSEKDEQMTPAQVEQPETPVLVKKQRGKKSVGKDV